MAVKTGDLLRIAVRVSWCSEWNAGHVLPSTALLAQAISQFRLSGTTARCTDTVGFRVCYVLGCSLGSGASPYFFRPAPLPGSLATSPSRVFFWGGLVPKVWFCFCSGGMLCPCARCFGTVPI